MNNLEKLTAGEVAARHNGTLDQLREVIEHCFQRHKTIIYGTSKYYYLASWDRLNWDCNETTDLPSIEITQLWQELQALKKPEIWWIRVTEDNKEVLGKWVESLNLCLDNIVGMYRLPNGNIHKGCILIKNLESETYDFGNEIDFATFLKYTGVEAEKVEKSLEEKPLHEKLNELSELVDLRNKAIARHKVIFIEIEQIETKISALLK